VQFHPETGAQSDAGADVLGNGRLKKGETHSKALIRAARGLVAARNATVSQEAALFAAMSRNAGPGQTNGKALKHPCRD